VSNVILLNRPIVAIVMCLNIMLFMKQPQEREYSRTPPSHSRTAGQANNDARVLAFAKNRVKELEQELKNTRAELELLRSRPSFAAQREEYVLGEMDHINRQLDCEFTTPPLFDSIYVFSLCLIIFAFRRFCS